ncbi:MAG TPA: class I SAM-dependent methyltransferase [Gemmatimonadales bacterium]|jgi:2-polyprenyl-3-methyl-5-hydroxy-6-metoxy-1,4-benzoquinol methylase
MTIVKTESTGERMIVDHYQSSAEDFVIYLMHVAAYRFAESFVRGRRVLDYGCGTGYGAASLAEVATEIVGVDVAAEAIAHARGHFQRANLRFQQVEAGRALPFADGAFDTVLSFQVLEHLSSSTHYLSEVRRVLAPGGCLILVTPNRQERLLPMQKPWNRWHVLEYSERTLREALDRYFESVQIQHMSGKPEVVGVELHRWRKLKWLTLPATLPILPDSLRLKLLNGLHAIRRVTARPGSKQEFAFDESDIFIGHGLEPSLNLVAIART